jgi:hypothetical protein
MMRRTTRPAAMVAEIIQDVLLHREMELQVPQELLLAHRLDPLRFALPCKGQRSWWCHSAIRQMDRQH